MTGRAGDGRITLGVLKGDYDAFGGPETLLVRLIPHLAGEGLDLVPIVPLRDAASALPARLGEAAGRPAATVPWNGPASAPAAARRVRALVAEHGIDVLHANDMRANLVAWLAALGRPRTPWIAHVHGWLGPTHAGRHRLYEAIDRRLAPRADASVCGSGATRGELVRAGARHPILVPNAVALPELPPRSPGAADVPMLGMLGRLHRGKGQDLFLRALAALRDRGIAFRGRIVGGGPFADELHALRAELGLRDRVELTGFVDDPAPHLAAMDIVAVPSRKESLPLAALEAMAAGRAVVASDAGDLPLAVGPAGRIVRAGDAEALAGALAALATDPAERDRLGRAARARIEGHYTVETMAARFAAVVREVAGSASR